jgi:acyl carrier protein
MNSAGGKLCIVNNSISSRINEDSIGICRTLCRICKNGERDVTLMILQDSSLEQAINKKLNEVLNRESNLEYTTDLRNEGLDSIKMIELIVSLEVEFDIEIEDQDLLIENFSTIEKIASLFSEKYVAQL